MDLKDVYLPCKRVWQKEDVLVFELKTRHPTLKLVYVFMDFSQKSVDEGRSIYLGTKPARESFSLKPLASKLHSLGLVFKGCMKGIEEKDQCLVFHEKEGLTYLLYLQGHLRPPVVSLIQIDQKLSKSIDLMRCKSALSYTKKKDVDNNLHKLLNTKLCDHDYLDILNRDDGLSKDQTYDDHKSQQDIQKKIKRRKKMLDRSLLKYDSSLVTKSLLDVEIKIKLYDEGFKDFDFEYSKLQMERKKIKKTLLVNQEFQSKIKTQLSNLDLEITKEVLDLKKDKSYQNQNLGLKTSETALKVKKNYLVWQDQNKVLYIVGKNQQGNDEITKKAKQRDHWFHIASQSGSHVTVSYKWMKDEKNRADIIKTASELAVFYSRGGHEGQRVEVYVTEKRFLKKNKKDPVGSWQVIRAVTVGVEVDRARFQSLLSQMIKVV